MDVAAFVVVFAVAAGDLAIDLAAAALVVASTEVDGWVEVGGSGWCGAMLESMSVGGGPTPGRGLRSRVGRL